MTYDLTWTDPSIPLKSVGISIPDGQYDTSTSLTLTGKGTAYGSHMLENLMRLLENFASDTAPVAPTEGQVWYDNTTKKLRVWKVSGGQGFWGWAGVAVTTEDVPPEESRIGDLWFYKTGANSGFLRIYTGVGRYPYVPFDPATAQPTTNSNAIAILNSGGSAGLVNYNETLICKSFTEQAVAGTITVASSGVVAMPVAMVYGGVGGLPCYIMWDQGDISVRPPFADATLNLSPYRKIRKDGDIWSYDTNGSWAPFTPTASQYIIGTLSESEYDDQTAPGITAGRIWSVAKPVLTTFIASIAALPWSIEVVAATTSQCALSGVITLDGKVLSAGDLVLVKDQATQSQNGVYVVSTNTWTRATSLNTTASVNGLPTVHVTGGTTNFGTNWVVSATINTIGADPITFTQLALYTAGIEHAGIGGWDQVWPTVEVAGGREEYDYVLSLVQQLIGDPMIFGGAGVINQIFYDFHDLTLSDYDFIAKSAAMDASLFSADSHQSLRVQPTSSDWDLLLGLAKYAIARLELPPSMLSEIADRPFVQDGAMPPKSLMALTPTSVAAAAIPSTARKVNQRVGSISQNSSFMSTVNALRSAVQFRYSLKGVDGSTGNNAGTMLSSLTSYPSAAGKLVAGAPNTAVRAASIRVSFDTYDHMLKFIMSGGILEFEFSHTGGSTGDDSALAHLCGTNGIMRVNADATRCMSSTTPRVLASNPVNVGLIYGLANYGAQVPLWNATYSTATISSNFVIESNQSLLLQFNITTAGIVTGSTVIAVRAIYDGSVGFDNLPLMVAPTGISAPLNPVNVVNIV